jgi:glyoxalase family protein
MSMSTHTPSQLLGYHHLTFVTGDPVANARFYTQLLRLRLVKQTVAFEGPKGYHLYYAPPGTSGEPGSILTFLHWPRARQGSAGVGGTQHIALRVQSGAALAYWRGKLEREDVAVGEVFESRGEPALRFTDPEGLVIELRAPAGDDVPEGAPDLFMPSLVPGAVDHALISVSNRETALVFYRDLLGFDVLDGDADGELSFGLPDGGQLIATVDSEGQLPRARIGAGQTHHLAFGVADDAQQLAWVERLENAGIVVTDVRDRFYFKSVYFRDPDGHLLEIATGGPGFTVDESSDSLGTALKLPPWLEAEREMYERSLPLLPAER